MSFEWNAQKLNSTFAALEKINDVKSVGVSKKGLTKVNQFSRFFQWLFKCCHRQQTKSDQVVPRIISLFEHLQKDENKWYLGGAYSKTLTKLIQRVEISNYKGDKTEIEKIKQACQPQITPVVNPSTKYDPQPSVLNSVSLKSENGEKKIEETKETLRHYASLFPTKACEDSEIDNMEPDHIKTLFDQLKGLKEMISKSRESASQSMFTIKAEENNGGAITLSWNGEVVQIRGITAFTKTVSLPLTTWALKEIVAGFILEEVSEIRAIGVYAPRTYKYNEKGVLSDVGRGEPTSAMFLYTKPHILPGSPQGFNKIEETPHLGMIVATKEGLKYIKNPAKAAS